MSKPLYNTLRQVRFAQLYLDFAIVFGLSAVVAFAIAWNASADQKRHANRLLLTNKEKPARLATGPLKLSTWHANFDEERSMWLAMGNWLSESEKSEGHCSISVRPSQTEPGIAVHCISLLTHAQKPAHGVQFEPLHVLALQQPTGKGRNRVAEDINPDTPAEPIKQQGWVDTHNGRRHFDVKQQRWSK